MKENNLAELFKQELGSWKLVKPLLETPSLRDRIIEFLTSNHLVKATDKTENVYQAPMPEIKIFFYRKGEFLADFNPEELSSEAGIETLLSFFQKIADEFKVQLLLFDETDHNTAIYTINPA